MYKISKKGVSVEELEADYHRTVAMLEEALVKDIEYADACTEEDFTVLMNEMLSNMAESIELMKKITAVRESLNIMYLRRNRLLLRRNLSSKEIFNNLASNINTILGIHNAFVIGILLSSHSLTDFMQRIATFLSISLSSFYIDYMYLKSNCRNDRINRKINTLNKYIRIDEIAMKTFMVCNEFYKKIIDYQNERLITIAPQINPDEDIETFLMRLLPKEMANDLIEKTKKETKTKVRKRY